MNKLTERKLLLKKILLLTPDDFLYQEELLDTEDKIATFAPVVEIFKTTQNVYTKKIDELTLNLQADIKKEMEKATSIGMIIFSLF